MNALNNISEDDDVWPVRAWHEGGKIHVELEDGRLIKFSIEGNPRLEKATTEQLGNVQILAGGLHWPDLDEDLSIEGILRGDYGQRIHSLA